MTRDTFEFTSAARLDLLELWNFLAQSSSVQAADKVTDDIHTALLKAAQDPQLGHKRTDLTNKPVLFYRVHSYLIVYSANLKPLRVIRILHTSRDAKSLLDT